MSDGYNIPDFALIKAMKLYLESEMESKIPVVRGDEFNEFKYPIAYATHAEVNEAVYNTATMNVEIIVGVMTDPSSTVDQHEEMVAQVMDLLFNDDLITKLNEQGVPRLVVQKVDKGSRSTALDNDTGTRNTAQRLTFLCSMDG